MSLNDCNADNRADRQMMLLKSMTVQMDGRWIKGTIGEYEFYALVFQTGSKYGINGGRVSKLSVRRKIEVFSGVSRYIINYDRGWDMEPETEEHKLILDTLAEYFENLPLEEIK